MQKDLNLDSVSVPGNAAKARPVRLVRSLVRGWSTLNRRCADMKENAWHGESPPRGEMGETFQPPKF